MTKTTTARPGRHLPEPGPRPNREQRVARGNALIAAAAAAAQPEITEDGNVVIWLYGRATVRARRRGGDEVIGRSLGRCRRRGIGQFAALGAPLPTSSARPEPMSR